MSSEQTTFPALSSGNGGNGAQQHSRNGGAGRQQYINNMLIEESLSLLPAAVDHPNVQDFMEYLREHLPQNSAITRRKYAEYIAYRYSESGRVNQALAQFLKLCPSERSRREALWFETVRTMPPLRELCESWLAALPEAGVPRAQLLEFLGSRVGSRNVDKIAKEAVGAIRKLRHLQSPKLAIYQAVWSEPPPAVLGYAMTRIFPVPAVVKMEAFKSDPRWRALLWRAGALERIILEGERTGLVSRVTRLDNYYQFALEGTGEERLDALLSQWRDGDGGQA